MDSLHICMKEHRWNIVFFNDQMIPFHPTSFRIFWLATAVCSSGKALRRLPNSVCLGRLHHQRLLRLLGDSSYSSRCSRWIHGHFLPLTGRRKGSFPVRWFESLALVIIRVRRAPVVEFALAAADAPSSFFSVLCTCSMFFLFTFSVHLPSFSFGAAAVAAGWPLYYHLFGLLVERRDDSKVIIRLFNFLTFWSTRRKKKSETVKCS